MMQKISSASLLSGTRLTYKVEILISALSNDISELLSMVWKKAQLSYISCSKERSLREVRPVPRLYHPGRLKRLCIHEKTQGMARIWFTAPVLARAAGRDPICRRLISSRGVADSQN